MDAAVRTDARTRLDAGEVAHVAEFDVIRRLTGVGGYLLRRAPHDPLAADVLSYVVRPTEPYLGDDGV
ncbi:hypothetical protein EBO15_16885 [Actinomadura harenae]|uniref:Uncharacterized protein n=1 Tax=Actinomadura harenae TaxID=2483351 RepID=A0A3M2M8A2_9ACTN|nr:hypothetical protein EBO15_16885 [Actinomadura harenae]